MNAALEYGQQNLPAKFFGSSLQQIQSLCQSVEGRTSTQPAKLHKNKKPHIMIHNLTVIHSHPFKPLSFSSGLSQK